MNGRGKNENKMEQDRMARNMSRAIKTYGGDTFRKSVEEIREMKYC
jgi:hypothetical protein